MGERPARVERAYEKEVDAATDDANTEAVGDSVPCRNSSRLCWPLPRMERKGVLLKRSNRKKMRT